MKYSVKTLSLAMVLAAVPMALFAHGGGSTGGGAMPSASGSASSKPDDIAKSAYNSGTKSVKKAQEYDADAAKASTPEKSAKAAKKAQELYEKAAGEFIDAIGAKPTMYEAWNYLGFCKRHLGNYDDSLAAYAKALELNPNYPDAIEYRGEAYLGLNKIEEAKTAYMTLFKSSRPLADELMVSMHRWADSRRKDAQGVPSEAIEFFATWMDERSTLAAQTASMAIGAPSPIWRQ
jgi:tetratricopeptide (TPR) repeat protein